MKRCKNCKHYTPTDLPHSADYANAGKCALMGDFNAGPNGVDRAAGWDYESYVAGVYVGPEFGCIHWHTKKTTKEQ